MIPHAPRAYLLTWTTRGARLHGDPRGSVDLSHNQFGTPLLAEDRARQIAEQRLLDAAPVTLDNADRTLIDSTIREVAVHRGWSVHALHVGSNHVHVVVEHIGLTPERMMSDWKAWTTRRLREVRGRSEDARPWTRHGSTRYLWNEASVAAAVAYVQDGQNVPR